MRFTSIFFKKLLIVFSILCLVVYLLARFVLPYAVIQPQRRHVDIDPSLISKSHEILTISMNETAALRGVLFHPENSKPKAIIILVHGIGGAKEHFFPLAAKLIQDGYCAIAMDNRAHGESDGDYVTYGYKEKIDISLIVNDLKEKFPDTKIGVWGSSMGGAIAIQAMEYDDRIEFGIIESTFTNLEQIVYDY